MRRYDHGVSRYIINSIAVCSLLFLRTDEAQATALSVDACALLQSAQISRAVGADVNEGVRNDFGAVAQGGYSSTCVWTLKDEFLPKEDPTAPLMGKHFVILNVIGWPSGQELAKTYLESFRTAATQGVLPRQPSPRNFGDEALWWGDGLAVRRADVSFGVSIFIPTRPAASHPGAQEEDLARLILQALDRTGAVPDTGDLAQ
jgi:hypothetical protein